MVSSGSDWSCIVVTVVLISTIQAGTCILCSENHIAGNFRGRKLS